MREVGAFEAKSKFGQRLDWVARGESDVWVAQLFQQPIW